MSDEKGFCLKMMPCECGSGNGGPATLPDLSFEEQFAGYRDAEGDKVYMKTIDINTFLSDSRSTVPHNISKFKRLIKFDAVYRGSENFGQGNYCVGGSNQTSFFNFYVNEKDVAVRASAYDWSAFSARLTVYYTCTDR